MKQLLVALILACVSATSLAQNPNPITSPHEQHQYGAALLKYASDPKDRLAGIGHIVEAAHGGYAEAQHDLAMLFENGLMGEPDMQQSRIWLESAASKGSVRAQLVLAQRLYTGEIYPRDQHQSGIWYLAAAAQGDASAQNNLAHMLENGIGFQEDRGRAKFWYKTAADRGNPTAQYNIASVLAAEREGAGDTGLSEITAWYAKAASAGHSKAQHELGLNYRDGIGVERDTYRAVFWLAEAAKAGEREANRDLVELLGWHSER